MRQTSRFAILVLLMFSFAWVCLANAGFKEGANFYSLNFIASLIQEYENPDRAVWQKPEKVVEYLMIKPGSVIADIGSGTGYFSTLLAKKVGEHGIVYAVDNDKEMIDYLTTERGLSRDDAYMLTSAAVDLHVTQVVDGVKGVHAMLPKAIFATAR